MRSQSSPSPSLHFPKSKHADLTSSSASHFAFAARCHLSILLFSLELIDIETMLHSLIAVAAEAGPSMSPRLSRIGLLMHFHDFVNAFRQTVEIGVDLFNRYLIVSSLLVCTLQLHWT